MTELELREKVVSTMQGWLGLNEKDGSFKTIIDLYNSYRPIARGYTVKYTDHWCAATVSAAFIKNGLTDIAPTECSCPKMIELYKKIGRWEENDGYVPLPGDVIMYDWQDNGIGDNTGSPDHVGIVEKISGSNITVIEGNKNEMVARRVLKVNGRYIRGFCLPDYASKVGTAPLSHPSTNYDMVSAKVPVLKRGCKGAPVKVLQTVLTYHGYDPRGIDGSFGPGCDKAVRAFQKDHGLDIDGNCGGATWGALIGG